MANISMVDKNQCTGCMACVAICPVRIIRKAEDDRGFKYSVIDVNDKCIDCQLCLKVCSACNQPDLVKTISGYASAARDDKLREISSSGGVFPVLGKYYINTLNGTVYGASFDEDFHVVHIRVILEKDILRLQGSKYVQSDMEAVYTQIVSDLKRGKSVLFTGTPCQCYGLKEYIQNIECNVSDLLLCEIICHGVNSPLVWNDYLNWRGNRNKIKSINFRDKRYGIRYYALRIDYGNYEICEKDRKDPYMDLFQSDYALREACRTCKYKRRERVSDLTIGDLQKPITNLLDTIDNNMGKSIVLVNTKKGEEAVEKINDDLFLQKLPIESYQQPNIVESDIVIDGYGKNFWRDYAKGFDYIVKRYTNKNYILRTKRLMKRLLRRFFIIMRGKKLHDRK